MLHEENSERSSSVACDGCRSCSRVIERSLEVIRIYRGLVDEDATRPESKCAFYLDEPALVTLE